MIKNKLLVLFTLLNLIPFMAQAQNVQGGDIKFTGDINEDGIVNITDVIVLVNIITSGYNPLTLSMEVGQEATYNILLGQGTYSVSSSDPSVATATVSGSTVTISGISIGTATVSVKNAGSTRNIIVTVKMKSYFTCPDDNHPHLIDLGLPSGTKWACCNVGADKPEEYGGYYAWGETTEKDIYDWSTYTQCDGSQETCQDLGPTICGTIYDAAYVLWKETWMMPSKTQIDELFNNCTSSITNRNGISGMLFRGSNDASIFLPLAGLYNCYYVGSQGKYGCYWTGTPSDSKIFNAYEFEIQLNNNFYISTSYRNKGFTIRPVSQ